MEEGVCRSERLSPVIGISFNLTICEPSMHDTSSSSLLPLKDSLVIRFKMDDKFLVGLHRIVQLKSQEILRIGQLLDH